MNHRIFAVLLWFCCSILSAAENPLSLHPENPHYFLFRGQPTILITSAEHYGAVLNRDFDYVKYLDELAHFGLNNTRTFTLRPDWEMMEYSCEENNRSMWEGRIKIWVPPSSEQPRIYKPNQP